MKMVYSASIKALSSFRCTPPGSLGTSLATQPKELSHGYPMYIYALLQKIAWAAEVLKLGYSVMWTDMDVAYFGNPLLPILEEVPHADLVAQSETCEFWRFGDPAF